MIRTKISRLMVSMGMALTMLLTSGVVVMAAAPTVEDIEYKGKGRVEMDFYGDVQYKNAKIVVKDTSGKKYKVSRVYKDDDEIKFTIKNYKKGKTYRVSVKGIKQWGTGGYGTASAKVKIPKAAKGKAISANKAISIAKKNAKNKWGAKGIWDVDVDRDRYSGTPVWEVSFSGTINGVPYEFEYEIARKGGKILRSYKEYDD